MIEKLGMFSDQVKVWVGAWKREAEKRMNIMEEKVRAKCTKIIQQSKNSIMVLIFTIYKKM